MAPVIHLRFLGTVQAEQDGGKIRGFRSRKALALLGYLAVQQHPVTREHLVDLLWSDQTESQGRANLSWVLNHISKYLPNHVVTDRHTVQRHQDGSYWLDVEAFTELEAWDEPAALENAVTLYRGEFLEGLFLDGCEQFEIWLTGEREHWRQRVICILQKLIAHFSLQGEHERSLHFANRLLGLEPWREETHRQVMRLLARSGQRSAALAQYKACRRILADELDVEPDEETTALFERIQAADTLRRHNLPVQPTPFVGREKELHDLIGLLSSPDCRLLTVLGPGGIGKTRLALQAAEAQAEAFLESVCFVPTVGVSSPSYLVSAIADALQISLSGAQPSQVQLLNYLRGKEMLLILDSFEHLLEDVGLLEEILQKAPEVKLLVTSRGCLNLRWEQCFELEGLHYPESETAQDKLESYDAVQLLVQTASRVQHQFSLSRQNRTAVARICRLVEGMPLGIELAAAWARTHTCQEIAAEIEKDMGFLTTSFRDMPDRHKSMWVAFEHSWNLLTPAEQSAFMQLSVFRGGFLQEAAGEVAGASPDILASLTDKSLIRLLSTGRYEIHELLRQYAAEKLATLPEEQARVQNQHCTCYIGFLQGQEADLTGPEAAQALAKIKTELANVSAAWKWAVAQDGLADIERGLPGLSRFCLLSGHYQEGAALLKLAADRLRELVGEANRSELAPQTALSRTLVEQALVLNRQGGYEQAVAAVQEAANLAQLAGAMDVESSAHLQWGEALFRQGAFDTAEVYFNKALTLARSSSQRQVEADSLRSLGSVYHGRGAYTDARNYINQARAICHEIYDQLGEGKSLNNLGAVCLYLGECTEAKLYYEQALSIARQIGDCFLEGAALHNLARVCHEQGDYLEARTCLEGALRIWRNIGDRQSEAFGLFHLGVFAIGEGPTIKAQAHCRQALSIFRELGARYGEGLALIGLGQIAHHQGSYIETIELLEQALCVCRQIGDQMGASWALKNLGDVYIRLGDYAQAQSHLEQALSTSREIGYKGGEGDALASSMLLSNCLNDGKAAHDCGQRALLIAREIGNRPAQAYVLVRLGQAFEHLDRPDEAAESYRQALSLRRELGLHNLAMEPLAGLVRVALAQSLLSRAQAQVEEILAHLETGTLEGTDEPFLIYLSCYHVLQANHDPRAEEVLSSAYNLLQEQAARIDDKELRRSFLENITAHREIVEIVEREDSALDRVG